MKGWETLKGHPVFLLFCSAEEVFVSTFQIFFLSRESQVAVFQSYTEDFNSTKANLDDDIAQTKECFIQNKEKK